MLTDLIHRLRVMFLAPIIGLFRRQRQDDDLNEEVRSHLDELTATYLRSGATSETARAATQRAFGGVEQIKECCRDERRFSAVEGFARDVAVALRTSLALAQRL
jgi:hypothetical protein